MSGKSLKEKGAVEAATILMWAMGLFITTSLGWNGWNATSNKVQDAKILEHEGKIGSLSASVGRLPYLEGKIDKMLEAQRISPADVEAEIGKQIQAALASSTSNQVRR